MNKMPLSRLSIALGLAMSALPLQAASPPDNYAKQIWMDETLTNVTEGDTAPNSVKADQQLATSGLIDVYQNGEGNQGWSTSSMPTQDQDVFITTEQKLTQTGSGNTLRIGQGATYDANAETWAGRWTKGTAVSGNVVGANQSGSDNLAEIYQLGNDNTANLTQSGSSGAANITQSSNNNTANVIQDDAGNVATINQGGNGVKTATISQSGFTGSGLGHTATITQNDTSNGSSTATITQTSSAASTAAVTQTGNTASSTTINQSGSARHNAEVYQNGGQLTVNQTGSAAQNLRLGNPQYAARFSNQGLTVTQSAEGESNVVNMASWTSESDEVGVFGEISQVGDGSSNLNTTIEVNSLASDSGVFINQSGNSNLITAKYTGNGGTIDIEQANGAGNGGNNITAKVSNQANITINQEGTSNEIDADLSGGSFRVGKTAKYVSENLGDRTVGQSGSNNYMLVRGGGDGVIVGQQSGENNVMRLGAADTGSTHRGIRSGELDIKQTGSLNEINIATVAASNDAPGKYSDGDITVTQGSGNLLNMTSTTANANINVTQGTNARADLDNVSSAVTILQ